MAAWEYAQEKTNKKTTNIRNESQQSYSWQYWSRIRDKTICVIFVSLVIDTETNDLQHASEICAWNCQ